MYYNISLGNNSLWWRFTHTEMLRDSLEEIWLNQNYNRQLVWKSIFLLLICFDLFSKSLIFFWQFSEIQEDFMSLEQQTSNFVIHLRGLNASEEKESRLSQDYQAQTSLSSTLPVVPVYVSAPEAAQSHSDPDTDPESPGASQKTHSKMSPFHKLCGMKKRKSST